MRLVLLSDVHGNPIALDAVLADAHAQGPIDAYWVLGDVAAIGYDPIGALTRLTQLPNVSFVRGNTDRYLTTGGVPPPSPAEVQANPNRLPAFMEIARSFAWTQGIITAAGWFDWFTQLPLEQRLTLPDGTRLLGVHASPGQDDGGGIHPNLSAAALHELVKDCNADVVCVAHTHWPLEVRAGAVRIVNLGSVSDPLAPDLRASYVILDADANGYRIQHRRVDYDHAAVIAAVQRVHHPAANFISQFMRGERQPSWK